jgi:hypothetical protein
LALKERNKNLSYPASPEAGFSFLNPISAASQIDI